MISYVVLMLIGLIMYGLGHYSLKNISCGISLFVMGFLEISSIVIFVLSFLSFITIAILHFLKII